MALLVAYEWPGNVRELQHAIERAAALSPNPILLPEDLPPALVGAVRQAGAPVGRVSACRRSSRDIFVAC